MRRGAAFVAGGLAVAAAMLAPMGMTGHMAAHMIAVAVLAPALALAIRGGALDPTRRGGVLASPLALMLVELAAVWLWHLPGARAASGASGVVMAAELACFAAAGTLLWSAVLAAPAEARAGGVGALLLTSMHMTLLGALIGLAPRALYSGHIHGAPLGLTPIEDQQLAGVVMLTVGGASYLIGGLAVLGSLIRQREAAA